MTTIDRSALLRTLDRAFNEGEARDFVFDLGGDWDNLPGSTKRDKLRELILRYERQGQADALIQAARAGAEGLFAETPVYQKSAADRAEDQQPVSPERRNELILLNKVRGAWIEGVLEQSLYGVARIALGLERQPSAVVNPWQMTLQRDGAERTLPPGTRMLDVFDSLQGSVLILGEPGAGKTTLLLELARDLIERAEVDEGHWLPVVFNLSSWAQKGPKLTEWLVDELNRRYDAPRKTGQAWVQAGRILPLLDGLDEVKAEQRAACLAAINNFRAEHGLVPIAVCCRAEEYAALGEKLRLGGAVLIQPLTPEQVAGYLAAAGAPLAGLRQAVAQDADLRELAQTPLMLSVMSLAYQETPASEIVAADNAAVAPGDEEARKREREQRLFARYVDTMLDRVARMPNELYPREKTEHWLAWLARSMIAHGQTTFYLEDLQPDWLGSERDGWRYRVFAMLATGLIGGPVGGLGFGLGFGLLGVLVGDMVGGAAVGLLLGLLTGLLGGLSFGLPFRRVEIVDAVVWSWWSRRRKLGGILTLGLVVGLIFGLLGGLGYGPLHGSLVGLLVGLVSALGGVLLDGLVGGRFEERRKPNEGIRNSMRAALIGGLALGLVGGAVVGLVLGLGSGLIAGRLDTFGFMLVFGFAFGLCSGLVTGVFVYGGDAVIRYYILRFLLWRQGAMPWNYVRFLEYAKERIFLRRVGGGYIFTHGRLMEYFASLAEDPHPGPLPGGEGD